MSIAWLNAAAMAGLALVALPIAIHLLVRQQTRTLAFPSLRFLQETALASFRRRTVQDAALLVCRIAVVAAAAIALAGPVLQTPARTAAHANRVARAIVVAGGDAGPGSETLAASAFRSARFARASVTDAVVEAIGWLDRQPPASREIVFAGTFRRGSIERADLDAIPAPVGIRFAPHEGPDAPADARLPVLVRRHGSLMFVERSVRLGSDDTEVIEGPATVVPEDRIRIVAAASDQGLANAALDAVLDAGVRWTLPARRVLIAWDSAAGSEQVAGIGGLEGTEIVRMPVPNPPASAASAVAAALDAATPRAAVEPMLIPRERLDGWSRPAGPPPPEAPPADEGDRRWFWALALVLIGLEHVLRRSRVAAPAAVREEARVA